MNKHFSINMVTYPMLRPFTIAALASICLLITAPRVDAGVMYTDVSAFSGATSVSATAAHGYIVGNEADGDGNPLLRFLNSGTNSGETLTLLIDPPTQFKISSTGMFSTNDSPFTMLDGFPVIDVVSAVTTFTGFDPEGDWDFVGKTDFNENGSVKDGDVFGAVGTGNTLILESSPISGSYVLSVKGGGAGGGSQYAVYLFQDLTAVTSFKLNELRTGLSHVSLYKFVPDDNNGGGGSGNNGVVPEPASLAIFGALLGIAGLRRRRSGVEKK